MVSPNADLAAEWSESFHVLLQTGSGGERPRQICSVLKGCTEQSRWAEGLSARSQGSGAPLPLTTALGP